jgi:hypothetical protein
MPIFQLSVWLNCKVAVFFGFGFQSGSGSPGLAISKTTANQKSKIKSEIFFLAFSFWVSLGLGLGLGLGLSFGFHNYKKKRKSTIKNQKSKYSVFLGLQRVRKLWLKLQFGTTGLKHELHFHDDSRCRPVRQKQSNFFCNTLGLALFPRTCWLLPALQVQLQVYRHK